VEIFFFAADVEPNALMDWIVANDIVYPDIISLGDISVLVI